jgi:putative endonuclease
MSEGWLRLHHGQRKEWDDLHWSDERSGKRVYEHREGLIAGFTKRYGCKRLVWFEALDEIQQARQLELQMKEWKRAWKVKRIEEKNFDWDDLYPSLFEPGCAGPGPRPSPGNEVA